MLRTSWLSTLGLGVTHGTILLQHRRIIDDVCTLIAFDSFTLLRHKANSLLDSATFVKARDAFAKDNRDVSIGKYAFGFTWGAWAALLIATVLFFLGTRSSDGVSSRRWRRTRSTRSRRSYDMGSRRVKDDYA